MIAGLVYFTSNAFAITQNLNFVPPASNNLQEGFVRLQNNNSDAVTVTVTGIDDAGNTGDSNITLTIPARASIHFNSSDIENGNISKGLIGAFGDGDGNWRLQITTQQRIKVSAFIRTPEGFLTQVDATVGEVYGKFHNVPIFNPGNNLNQVSKLRIINTANINNTFLIGGVDSDGYSSVSSVTLTLAPFNSVEITSQDLENGNIEKGLTGSIGTGSGKWSLDITSGYTSIVMNFLEAPGGYLSNLSNIGNKELSFEDLTCESLDGARIYSTQEPPVYLGFLGSSGALDSINNSFGTYGSEFAVNGLRNSFSTYGSEFNLLSHTNPSSTNPPVVVKQGNSLMLLSTNTSLSGRLSLAYLDEFCNFTATSASDTFGAPK